VFGKIDTDAQPQLAGAFSIRSIPTLMIFRDGVLLFSQAGALPASALEDLVAKVREVDMAEVRRKIAELEKSQGATPPPASR
jgi:thioredoxin 1